VCEAILNSMHLKKCFYAIGKCFSNTLEMLVWQCDLLKMVELSNLVTKLLHEYT